jgi:hydroxysqualene dehydroxylase
VTDRSFDAIVIGAGFAGLSAATKLAADGARVLVLEARPGLGGRASAFVDPRSGEAVDNGQHLMLGCYYETLEFLDRIGARQHVSLQPNLEVPFVDTAGVASVLSCPSLPSPLHLLAGLFGWKALGWRDRFSSLGLALPLRAAQRALATGFAPLPVSDAETVEDWLIRNGQSERLREMLWEPLGVAALNQSIGEAAAPSFVRVLAQMFGTDRSASAIAMPLVPLTALYADPSVDFVLARSGVVLASSPARAVIANGRIDRVEVRGQAWQAPVVIVSTPWHALADTLVGDTAPVERLIDAASRVEASPIVTVNLWLDRAVLPGPFVGLPGRTFQWVFDKRQVFGGSASHLSFVSSGAAAVVVESNDALAEKAWTELRSSIPAATAATVLRSLVVRERRATFSLAPGQPSRPGTSTQVSGLWLAGDWTDTSLPATIEGAVVSGHRAAEAARQRNS